MSSDSHAKRMLDLLMSLSVLTGIGPVLLLFMFLVWRHDKGFPLYLAKRIGRGGNPFTMVKLRSMRLAADQTGVQSTSAADDRITPVGHLIRRYKLDEFTQFWNVLVGEMSVVGPRPQVPEGVADYTDAERGLLEARPGITDFSSIVFADEGDILADSPNPDADYDRIIRPWKSRLGLFYVEKRSLPVDMALIGLTAMALVSRRKALDLLAGLLAHLGADAELVEAARREGQIPQGDIPE